MSSWFKAAQKLYETNNKRTQFIATHILKSSQMPTRPQQDNKLCALEQIHGTHFWNTKYLHKNNVMQYKKAEFKKKKHLHTGHTWENQLTQTE